MTDQASINKNPAFQMITLDTLRKVLERAETPSRFGEFFADQAREISGARLVMLVQHIDQFDSIEHRIVSARPERRKGLIQSSITPYRDELSGEDSESPHYETILSRAYQESEITLWKYEDCPDEVRSVLQQLNRMPGMIVPLVVGEQRAGSLLLLGLPPETRVQSIAEIFDPLSGVVASLMHNSIAFEQMEQMVEHRTRQLRESEEQHRLAKEAAEQASQCKSRFLANMSHEIRTPLTAIIGFAETIIENSAQEEISLSASIVYKNGKHLLAIISDILDISKIEAGKMVVEKTWCPTKQVIDETLIPLEADARRNGIELTVEVEGQLPEEIHTDSLRLKQVIINIVGNAVKFTEKGTVQVRVSQAEDLSHAPMLIIEVDDDGIGIAEHDLAILFAPFSQADYSKTKRFGGTGLGLAISQRIMQMLGGNIGVRSTPGLGSVFTISLPAYGRTRLPDPQQNSGNTNAQRDSGYQAIQDWKQVDLSGMQLMLVEDGVDNQRLIGHILQKVGAMVTLAENGMEAVSRFQELMGAGAGKGHDENNGKAGGMHDNQWPDAVLMDMQMPVMNGFEATRAIRELGYQGPVIALTAFAMDHDRRLCLEAGCDTHLSKPIDRISLTTTIRRLVDSNRRLKAERILGNK